MGAECWMVFSQFLIVRSKEWWLVMRRVCFSYGRPGEVVIWGETWMKGQLSQKSEASWVERAEVLGKKWTGSVAGAKTPFSLDSSGPGGKWEEYLSVTGQWWAIRNLNRWVIRASLDFENSTLTTSLAMNTRPRCFPSGSVVEKLPAVQEPQGMWVWFLGWEDLLKEGMATHSLQSSWLENSMDRRAWWL